MTNFATPVVADQMSLAAHMLSTQLPECLAKYSVFFLSLGFIKPLMSLLLGLLPPFHLSILV